MKAKYTDYKNGKYIGSYDKAITNIKLRGWNLPEVG